MSPSESTSTTDERPVSTPSPGKLAGLRDRLSMRGYLAKKSVNEAAIIWLQSELAAARPEFEHLVELTGSEGVPWAEQGAELLEKAETALSKGAIEIGWRHYHTAKRFEIYGLETLDQMEEEDQRSSLKSRAAVVRERALEKLDGWRRRTVVHLLCDENEELKDEITGFELRSATRILHAHYESDHLLRSERQRQFNQLALLGTFSGLFLFLLTLTDWLLDGSTGLLGVIAAFLETPFGTGEIAITSPGFAVFMTIVGVMGASLFGLRSLQKRAHTTKIPQQINQLTVTGVRAVIGAISALLFYFVLQTPLLQDGILAQDVISAPMMVVVGFAAGYTERMAPSVVDKVASLTASATTEESSSNQ